MSYACDNCDRRITNVAYKIDIEVLRGPADSTDQAMRGHFCCAACLCQHSQRARGSRPDFAAARRAVDPDWTEEDESARDAEVRFDSGELQDNVDQVLGIVGRKHTTSPVKRNWGLAAADTIREIDAAREAKR